MPRRARSAALLERQTRRSSKKILKAEAAFEALYGSEEKCRAAILAWRWPNGFVCPHCGSRQHSHIITRDKFQCSACRKQTTPIAGTIFAATKAPLTTWFRAMYHLTQSKHGISSIELGRRLRVTQTTAWKMKTKLAEVMRRSSDKDHLQGRIEMDDTYLGGKRSGGKTGRGSLGKTPIIAAVETTDDGKPKRLKIRRIARFKRKRVKSLAQRMIAVGWTVFTDGLACFRGIADAGSDHTVIITGSGRRAARHPGAGKRQLRVQCREVFRLRIHGPRESQSAGDCVPKA